MNFLYAFLFFSRLFHVKNVLCDIEYTHSELNSFLIDADEHETGNGLNILDQKNKICEPNSDVLWRFLLEQIDLNNDSAIDFQELNNYLSKRIKKLHEDELNQQINRLDVNKTGLIEFAAYIRDAFDNLYDSSLFESSWSASGLDKSRKEDDEYEELKILYSFEKEKWYYLSSRSEFLTYDQFYKFVYTEENPALRDFEAKSSFRKFDSNDDNLISVDEFLQHVQEVDQTMINTRKHTFSKSLDTNLDNGLDFEEFKNWFMPSFDQIIKEEENYIAKCCDENKDKRLNRDEVKKNCPTLLNSQLTNFGIDLNMNRLADEHNRKFNDEL